MFIHGRGWAATRFQSKVRVGPPVKLALSLPIHTLMHSKMPTSLAGISFAREWCGVSTLVIIRGRVNQAKYGVLSHKHNERQSRRV